MSKGRVLITGGAGFAGWHTAKELLRASSDMHVLGNLTRPVHSAGNEWPAWLSKDVERIPERALLSFGDGHVEIENTKEVGGLPTVAVASDKANNGSGQVDKWKRNRLLAVGVEVITPYFLDTDPPLRVILGEA